MNALDRLHPSHRCPLHARATQNADIAAVVEVYPDEYVMPLSDWIDTELKRLEERFAAFITKSSGKNNWGR